MADIVYSSPILSSVLDSDLLKSHLLDKLFFEGGQDVEDCIETFFIKEDLDEVNEKVALMAGVGRSRKWGEMEDIVSDQIEEVWKVIYTYDWYENAVTMDKDAVLNLKSSGYGVIGDILDNLGFMATVSQQELAAKFIEDNATQTQMDNVALFSTAHPLSTRLGGATYSNYKQGQVNFPTSGKPGTCFALPRITWASRAATSSVGTCAIRTWKRSLGSTSSLQIAPIPPRGASRWWTAPR